MSIDIAHRVCEAWTEIELPEWHSIATPAIQYRNMPWPDLVSTGPDEVFASLQPFVVKYDVRSEILTTIETENDLVVERIETLTSRATAGLACSFHCVGVFRFSGGRLAEWRDYFDGAPLVQLLRGDDHH